MAESPLVMHLLGSFSQRLAAALFENFPIAKHRASMIESEEPDGQSLIARIPSPVGDSERDVLIWVDEAATPSIEFGPSHTHGSPDDSGIAEVLELCKAILSDQFLIIQDQGGKYDGHAGWVDIREPDALIEELTSPYSPGHAVLKSWSGRADRVVGVDGL
jgi:hypothetical protein